MIGIVGRQKGVLRAKVARRERHGHQELRGARKDISSFRALTKSMPAFAG
jgi:hypothetical protein